LLGFRILPPLATAWQSAALQCARARVTDNSSRLKKLNHLGDMLLVRSLKSLNGDADLCRLVSMMDYAN
jgi:hypothetical protein